MMCTTFLGSLQQELKERPELLAGETEKEEIYCGCRDQMFALDFAEDMGDYGKGRSKWMEWHEKRSREKP